MDRDQLETDAVHADPEVAGVVDVRHLALLNDVILPSLQTSTTEEWARAVNQALLVNPPEMAEGAKDNVAAVRELFGWTAPPRAWVGGRGTLRKALRRPGGPLAGSKVTFETFELAVRLGKAAGRIVQGGYGKGAVLILTSSLPVGAHVLAPAPNNAERAAATLPIEVLWKILCSKMPWTAGDPDQLLGSGQAAPA